MDESKRKKIEAQLRQMFVNEDQLQNKNHYPAEARTNGVKVIRRRKGLPDREIK